MRLSEIRQIIKEELKEAIGSGKTTRVAVFNDDSGELRAEVLDVFASMQQVLGWSPSETRDMGKIVAIVDTADLMSAGDPDIRLMDDDAGDYKAEIRSMLAFLSSMTPPVKFVAHENDDTWEPLSRF